MQQRADQYPLGVLDPAMRSQAGGLLGGFGGAAIGSIKAYHGSPHDFNAFDLSKIGTGEGAQAYGHGLYFAENEGTAKSYRDALSPSDPDVMNNALAHAGMAGLMLGSGVAGMPLQSPPYLSQSQ
jgi:hypothetical protein